MNWHIKKIRYQPNKKKKGKKRNVLLSFFPFILVFPLLLLADPSLSLGWKGVDGCDFRRSSVASPSGISQLSALYLFLYLDISLYTVLSIHFGIGIDPIMGTISILSLSVDIYLFFSPSLFDRDPFHLACIIFRSIRKKLNVQFRTLPHPETKKGAKWKLIYNPSEGINEKNAGPMDRCPVLWP